MKVVIAFSLLISTALVSPTLYTHEGSAYINCNDEILVKKMERAGIAFSCLTPTDASIMMMIHGNNRNEFEPQSIEEEIAFVKDCSDPMGCAETLEVSYPNWNGMYADSPVEGYLNANSASLRSKVCKAGYSYDEVSGKCLVHKKAHLDTARRTPTPVYKNVAELPSLKTESLKSLECKSTQTFNVKLNRCVENPLLSALDVGSSLRQVPASSTKPKCPPGYVYNASIDYCLPLTGHDGKKKKKTTKNQKRKQTKLHSASLVAEGSDESSEEKQKCEPGWVMVGELDMCLPYNRPINYNDQNRRPQSAAQLAEVPIYAKKQKCDDSQTYNSEIDMCM